MTATVKKGANRASAMGRRARHAQRTPLPAKAGLPNAPRSVTKNLTAVLIREEHDKMAATPTAAQTKALAAISANPTVVVHHKVAEALVANGWARHLKDGRWKIMAPGKRYVAATGAESPRTTKPTQKRSGSRTAKPAAAPAPESSALDSKAQKFVDAAMANGWDVRVEHPRRGVDQMTATRGDEVVYCARADGKLDLSDMPYASVGERTVKLRNLSACIHQMTLPESDRPVRRDVVQVHRRRSEAETDQPMRAVLPFNEDSTDEEIINAILSRNLTWRNGVSGVRLEQLVTSNPKHIRIDTHPNGRIITFNGVEVVVDKGQPQEVLVGTYSVYVHRILKVK